MKHVASIKCLVTTSIVITWANVVLGGPPVGSLAELETAICHISTTWKNLDVSEIKVNFYDFQNGIQITNKIVEAFDKIINNINLDLQRRLNIYIPGFRSNLQLTPADAVRAALRGVRNIYLIEFDYSHYSNVDLNKEIAEKAMPYVFDMGSAMGQFLAQLYKFGFSAKNIHAFGHSLGGQLVGFMGDAFKNVTGTKIGRITGLDPVKVCFDGYLEAQLRSGQADYVEVIHCAPGGYGTTSNISDAEFYYNREDAIYPGCEDRKKYETIDKVKGCEHIYCVNDYMRTVYEPSWFKACADYKDYLKHDCANSEVVYSGYFQDNTPKGIFYVSTKVNSSIAPTTDET